MDCLRIVLVGCVLTCAASAEEPKLDPMATRDYAVADGLQAQGLYPEAILRWQKFLTTYTKDPRRANAEHNLGICLLQSKKFPEAIATFQALLKDDKFQSKDAAHFNIALAQYNIGLTSKKPEDLQTAAKNFAEVVAKFPKSANAPSACYYEGECHFATNQLPQAIAAYQKLITTFPTSPLLPEAYYALGTTQQDANQHKEATQTYRTFLAKYAKDSRAPEIQLRLGQTLVQQKQYPEAERTFAKVAAIPKFELADYALMQQAECVEAAGKLPQAAALFEQVPRRFPKTAYAGLALLGAGKCWFRQDNFANAERLLRQAVARKGETADESAYWLARSLVALKRYPQAVSTLDVAMKAHPKSKFLPQMQYTRISALYEQPPRRKETVALYETFAKTHAKHELAPKAKYMGALAAMQTGDLATARRLAEEFLATADYSKHDLTPSVLFLAGETYLEDAKPDLAKAEAHYRKILAEHAKHKQAIRAKLRVGFCRYSAKDAKSAIPLLTEALAGLPEADLKAEAAFLLGRCQQDVNDPDKAIAALKQSIAIQAKWPRGDEVRLALAVSLRSKNQHDEAKQYLAQIPAQYPQSVLRDQAYYQLGEIAFDKKAFAEARGQYNQVVANFAKSNLVPLARYGIASTYFEEKNFPETVKAIDPLLASKPSADVASKSQFLRGLAHHHLKNFAPASADLAAFLAGKPAEKEALDAMHILALCQVGAKQYNEAAATLTDLMKRAPKHPKTDQLLYEKAFALLEAKKPAEMATTFEDLTTRFPTSPLAPECHFRLGEYHESAKDLAKAEAAYTAAGNKAKRPALQEKAAYKLGWVRHQQKKYPEAAATLQAQIDKFPKGGLVLDGTYLAGESLYRADQRDKALPLFEKVVAAKSEKYQVRALYRVGICYAGLEKWEQSATAYSTLIEQFPKFELVQEARYGLGLALKKQDKLAEAIKVLEVITDSVSTETAAKARFLVGECVFDQKKYREAATHFLEAAIGYPYPEWRALSYYEAGRCFKELKDFTRARENFKKLIMKFPDHPRAKDAEKLLANLP